jgi:hypothetical protein
MYLEQNIVITVYIKLSQIAVPWPRRLVAIPPPPPPHCGGLGLIPAQYMWDLWWTKWHWDRFPPPSTLVFPRQFHSTGAPLLGKMEKTNQHLSLHLHHRVARLALRPWCIQSICCRAPLHKKNSQKYLFIF